VEEFKELLRENKVNQFSFWDRVVSKISLDPRFELIPDMKQRKAIFEQFTKSQAQEKNKQTQQLQENKSKILEQTIQASITDYSKFLNHFQNQSSFTQFSNAQRKELFDEAVKQIKINEKHHKQQKRETFKELLRDSHHVKPGCHWSRVKHALSKDDRYYAVSSEEREQLFDDYMAKLEKSHKRSDPFLPSVPGNSVDKRTLSKQKRAHDIHVAETDLRCLYEEMIKSHQTSWQHAMERLCEQPRFRVEIISMRRKRELFDEYIHHLQAGLVDQFCDMLEKSFSTIPLGAKYEDIESLISTHPKFNVLPTSEDRKRAYGIYQSKLLDIAVKGFSSLLEALKTITLSKSGPQFDSALGLLKNDPRWSALDPFPDKRQSLIDAYVNSKF
jgi:hypothetical protein